MNWKEKYQEWLLSPNIKEEFKLELVKISDEKELEDRFYRYLEFGTGGMRGELGAGINRINEYTIKRIATALAQYIKQNGEQKKGVVISYDNRLFSKYFAEWTARILASHEIQVYLSNQMRPTPELSFLVREYQATAGVMITASHNPAQYNGFKVYGSDGGQITLETANQLMILLEQISCELEINAKLLFDYEQEGIVQIFGQEADGKYLHELKQVTQRLDSVKENGHKYAVVYSPLHGTGLNLVEQGLKNIGISNLHTVSEQSDGEGTFHTVKSPNPEDQAAFFQALVLAKQLDAGLVMATDPDADRLGIAVKDNSLEEYYLLNGNQIGALLLFYLLESKQVQQKKLSDFFIAKTIVTSELGTKIASDYDVETRNTLTGFKFIGEQIEQSENNRDKQFLFGYEESYGYLIYPFVRDKDAIQAAVLMAELYVYYQEKNQSILEVLNEIYKKYGYYQESLVNIEFKGKTGQEEMEDKLSSIRKAKLNNLDNVPIIIFEDYLTGQRINLETGIVSHLLLPKSNVLKYIFEDGSWFCIRPSGTEPKCKIYFSVCGTSLVDAEKKLEKLTKSVNKLF